MHRSTTTILLTLLLSGGPVRAAEEWTSVGKSADGKMETFVDISSIHTTAAISRVWARLIVAPGTRRGEGPDASKWLSSVMNRLVFNCADETGRSEAITYYFDDGTNESVSADQFPTPWEPVAPDTQWSTVMHLACGWRPIERRK
jgi:hypothetical protein